MDTHNMRKWFFILIIASLAFSILACNNTGGGNPVDGSNTSKVGQFTSEVDSSLQPAVNQLNSTMLQMVENGYSAVNSNLPDYDNCGFAIACP